MCHPALEWLQCPSCRGHLVPARRSCSPDYYLLTCRCSRYPVLAGIPIIKRGVIGSAGETVDEVIRLLEAGRYRDALLTVLLPSPPAVPTLAPAWMQALPELKGIWRIKHWAHAGRLLKWNDRAERLLIDDKKKATARDLFAFFFLQSGFNSRNTYDYFLFRFGQPRHLVALSLLTLIERPQKPILDLACGFGHLTRNLVFRAGSQPVFGLDAVFFTLYVAKQWLAPEACYVCCPADQPLPFADQTFSAILCSDAFHVFTDKASCIRELKRLMSDDGLILLVSVQNALMEHLFKSPSLSPRGYEDLVADLPHRIVPDGSILNRYLQRLGPALSHQPDLNALCRDPFLSVVVSKAPHVFRDHGVFHEWPHAQGRLSLNPLYVRDSSGRSEHARFRRSFPSRFYEEENAAGKDYLPEEVQIRFDLLQKLEEGRYTPEMEPFIARCVLLGLPERYL